MTDAHIERHGPTAVIRFSHPPVNTLAHALRAAVSAQLRPALEDPAVGAIVLAGEGKGFCAGAEIREFNTPKISEPPTAHDIWASIELADKPVVAAIHGLAMGGGLEFAMSCHYRVAAPDARLALPEVRLGLLPGAGGTQRLPRAVGVARALEMMTTGQPVAARELAATPLVDRLAESDVVEAALEFCEELRAKRAPLHRLRDMAAWVEDPERFFAEARRRIAREFRGYQAPLKIVDCIEAATLLPFDEGLKFERARFQELVNGRESRALRRAFFGRRSAAKREGFETLAKNIAARMREACRRRARTLAAGGVSPAQIDRALVAWGMKEGPLAAPPSKAASRPTMPDDEIVEACLAAMAIEGSRLLQEDATLTPVEIDMACLARLGFPPHRGGPMFCAGFD